ncbi:hypothetical protein Tco_0528260 [Tanacetum coccineum]
MIFVKPAESEGFEQIVDFLNAHTIKYALTVNPKIDTSCIEQFWAIVKAKTVNGEVQLQARVDGKKIIVTEASIRSDLQLNVEEGMDCLPNATIFEELTRMGAKTTAWNEFSSTMASAIICLATNQKFNFSKYIFESMVKKLDNAGKFLMFPRFVQVFLDKQLKGMSSHKRIYVTPSHTKKIFGNMKRVGKGFLGMETPLFPTMVVQNQAEMGEGSAIPTDPHHTPTIIQPSTSQPEKKQRSRRPKRKDTEVPQPSGPTTNIADEAVYEERDNSLERAATTATGLDAEQDRVIDLEKTKTAQAQEITSLKLRVEKLEKKGGSKTHKIKILYKVGRSARIVSSDEAKITLVYETQGRYSDDIMFDVSDLAGEEVFVVEQGVSNKDVNLSVDEVTLAQTLAALKSAKAKGLVIHEEEQATTLTVSSQQPSQANIQDKSKAKMIEPEPVKKLSKKDQLKLDKEVAQRLQGEFDEQESIEREKSEANIALKEIWDDIQAKIESDYLLAERLLAREQEELTIEERAILFQQLLEKRRKHFAAKRPKRKGTDHQQKLNKGVSSMKRVNTFIDYRTELVEGSSEKAEVEIAQESSSKRARDELEQESIKKQKGRIVRIKRLLDDLRVTADKEMHFLLSSMSVVYVLTTHMPEDGGDNPIVEQFRKRAKWDNDNYVCRGLILNGMSDSLFDIYQNVESSKELWDSLEAKYMAEDASSKKFLISNFTNYKMSDSRPVMEQYNELLGILRRFTQHKINMDEAIQVSCIIDKLSPSWKDFKHTLKHLKEEFTLVELGSHLRIESLRVQDSDKPKGNNVAGPSVVNMVEHNNSSSDLLEVWETWTLEKDCKGGIVGNKANGSGTKGLVDGSANSLKGATVHVCKDKCWFKTYESLNDGSILHMENESIALMHGRGCIYLRFSFGKIVSLFNVLDVPNIRKNLVSNRLSQGYWDEAMLTASYLLNRVRNKRNRAVVRLLDLKLETLGERGIECIFVGYVEHSNAFRTEDIGSLVVLKEVTGEVVQQPEPELRKSKRNRTPKNFGPEFHLYLIEGIRDEVSDQHSYCFNIEDDPKIFYEAMKSQDFFPGKKQTRCSEGIPSRGQQHLELIEIVRLPGLCKRGGARGGCANWDLQNKKLRTETEIMSTPMDTSEKLMPNIGQVVSQLEYSRVIGCLMYAMTCTRPYIAFVMGKLSMYTSNPGTQHWQTIQRVLMYLKKTINYRLIYSGFPSVLEGYTDAGWISNTEDNSSTSGWVFLFGGGAIFWASNKKTCITGSTMEYEFVALAAASKEVEWLKNLVFCALK